jgi:hypothetical protein
MLPLVGRLCEHAFVMVLYHAGIAKTFSIEQPFWQNVQPFAGNTSRPFAGNTSRLNARARARGTPPKESGRSAPAGSGRMQAAREAGLSKDQAITALRVNNVPTRIASIP